MTENDIPRIVSALEKDGLVTDKISEGETKFMGVCRLDDKSHYRKQSQIFVVKN